MHDENTVAFEIRRPWPARFAFPLGGRRWHWPALVTVWHVGERCLQHQRWPRPDAKAEAMLREMADQEAKWPHWFTADGGEQTAKLYSLWATFAWRTNYAAPWYTRLWRRRDLPLRFLALAMWLVGNEHDNVRQPFVAAEADLAVRFPASTRMEWRRDDPPTGSGRPAVSAEAAYERLSHLWSIYARESRPFWQHWQLHAHHWRVQVHPFQQLRRWLLTRCGRCGLRFRWGESVVGFCWDKPHRPWWRGEADCHHVDCAGTSPAKAAEPRAEE